MLKLLSILLSFSIGACAMRKPAHETPGPTKNVGFKEGEKTPEYKPGPLVNTLPVPSIPDSSQPFQGTEVQGVQGVIQSDFASIVFQDMGGFDAPMITIAIPQSGDISSVTSDQFKVKYTANTTNADSSLPSDLTSSQTGYIRSLQFMLPVFTATSSVQLELCDEQECYNSTTVDLTNERALDSTSSQSKLKLAQFFVKLQNYKQDIFTNTNVVHGKLPDVVNYVNNCPNKISSDQKQTLQTLASMSESDLEIAFLTMPPSSFVPLLSQDFKNKVNEQAQSSGVMNVVSHTQGIIGKTLEYVGMIVSGVLFINTIYDTIAWRFELKDLHTVTIKNKEITLQYDSLTGFLVDPEDVSSEKMGKYKKYNHYYIEDPTSKAVLKISKQTVKKDTVEGEEVKGKQWEETKEFATIDPIKNKLYYENGRFYECEYADNGKRIYTLEDKRGNTKTTTSSAFDPRSLFGRDSSYREYAIKRNDFPAARLTEAQIQEFGKGNIKSAFDSRKSLNPDNTNKGLVTIESKYAPPWYASPLAPTDYAGIHQLKRFTIPLEKAQYLIKSGVALGSLVYFATTLATQKSILELADSTSNDKNTDICTKGASLSPYINNIAQDLTLISLTNIQITNAYGLSLPTQAALSK